MRTGPAVIAACPVGNKSRSRSDSRFNLTGQWFKGRPNYKIHFACMKEDEDSLYKCIRLEVTSVLALPRHSFPNDAKVTPHEPHYFL